MATNQNLNKAADDGIKSGAKKKTTAVRKTAVEETKNSAKPKTASAKKTTGGATKSSAAPKTAAAKKTAGGAPKTGATTKKTASKKTVVTATAKAPAKKTESPVVKNDAKTPALQGLSQNQYEDQFKIDNEARMALLSNIYSDGGQEKDNTRIIAPSKNKFDWKKWTIFGAGIVIAALILIFCIRGCVSAQAASAQKERDNTIALVQNYIDKGLYDEALDLLNRLVIKNPDDVEAQDLLSKAAELKKLADAMRAGGAGGAGGSVSVNVDTSNLADAMQASIDSMKEQLSKQQAANAQTTQELNNLLKKQQEQADSEKTAQAEKQAQQAAEAKQRAAEEAERKEKEAELAKKDAAFKKLMENVDDEIKQGEGALNLGDVTGALDHFSKAKSILPTSDSDRDKDYASSKLGQIAGDLYDASTSNALAKDSPNKEKLADNAVSYANDSIVKNTHNGPSHYVLGMYAFEKKNYDVAEKELKLAVAEDTNNSLYYYQLGRVQATVKKYTAARASFNSSIKYDATYAPAQYNLGFVLERLTLPSDALKAYRKAYQIDPNYERAYLAAARILVKDKDYNGAINDYKEAIRINSGNINTYKEEGSAYSSAGDDKNAETCYRTALSMLKPNEEDPATNYNLSTVLFNQGKTDDALKYAKKAYDTRMSATEKSVQVNSIYNYGLMCDETGDVDKAIKLYSEVLDADSTHIKARINLANIYLAQNDPDLSYTDNAIKLLNVAYKIDPNNFEVNNSLGNAYLKKKEYNSAITYLQAALVIDSKKNVARSNLAKAFASAGQYDNAKVTYQEVIKREKKDWDSYIELAKVCITLKDNTEAEGYLLYVQKNNPEYRADEVKNLLDSITSDNSVPAK